eukprot:TRINITY_DN1031_c0_g1_i1.p1 TRINITY_DN1031_c0_g1~~TRINITY_DN1031_c0_g1_i1.p1  ORF type:complete len:166 (-),score=18.52 TRINITY_DN1031_c0_g1_i1:106-603(-)
MCIRDRSTQSTGHRKIKGSQVCNLYFRLYYKRTMMHRAQGLNWEKWCLETEDLNIFDHSFKPEKCNSYNTREGPHKRKHTGADKGTPRNKKPRRAKKQAKASPQEESLEHTFFNFVKPQPSFARQTCAIERTYSSLHDWMNGRYIENVCMYNPTSFHIPLNVKMP